MKVNHLLVILLLVVGLVVGAISLYMASLSGVMNKMGLVGGDFRDSVKTNELARLIIAQKGTIDCSFWNVGRAIPGYLYSDLEDKVALSRELGGQRIVCGVKHVQAGNLERGVYTIIKGLYYLKSHYTELRLLVQKNPAECEKLQVPDYEQWIEGYLGATEGRAHELVFDIFTQVESARSGVEELCID